MTQLEKWEIFDEEEEALSLSDLPLAIETEAAGDGDDGDQRKSSDVGDDFEFSISVGGGLLSTAAEAADMCAADEVFFQGQILPLRPSVSSDNGLSAASRGPSRCGSRSESTEWHSAGVLSMGFDTSRSNSSSSSRSSSCVSRCHSSNSHSSSGAGAGAGACDPPRPSLSNNFYSHPSPTPRVRIVRKASGAGRRSTSAPAPPGWGIFRLGVVKAPEIELYDLRSRRSNSGGTSGRKSNADVDSAVKHALGDKAGAKAIKNRAKSSTASIKEDQKKKAPRAITGFGFNCRCSPDAAEPSPASKAVITRKKKEETLASLKRGESVGRSSRMFEWLEELSAAKAAAGGSS